MVEQEFLSRIAYDQAHMAWGLFFPTAIAILLAILVRLRGRGYTPVLAFDLVLTCPVSLDQ